MKTFTAVLDVNRFVVVDNVVKEVMTRQLFKRCASKVRKRRNRDGMGLEMNIKKIQEKIEF